MLSGPRTNRKMTGIRGNSVTAHATPTYRPKNSGGGSANRLRSARLGQESMSRRWNHHQAKAKNTTT
jgi:hypothetical protein